MTWREPELRGTAIGRLEELEDAARRVAGNGRAQAEVLASSHVTLGLCQVARGLHEIASAIRESSRKDGAT